FLTTGFLDGTAVPWWDAINLAMREAPVGRIRLQSLDQEFTLASAADRARSAGQLRARFRSLPPARYADVLAELADVCGCALGADRFAHNFMRWDEARQLAKDSFEIGAHTRTHPVLSQVDSPK